MKKDQSKRSGYVSDDENVRYKLNKQYFDNISKNKINSDDSDNMILYKFPPSSSKQKTPPKKTKSKPKIKVNFWRNKQSVVRLNRLNLNNETLNRRHTIGVTNNDSSKQKVVKVRKRVSFLPTPLFTENHIPMVTVPDDLTINLNEEEANELRDDLNNASDAAMLHSPKRKLKNSNTQISPKGTKRKASPETNKGHNNEKELEFFSNYIVQKLRKMETNQRIYSENLINTVLMLGQLRKLNGKYKIIESLN